MIAPYREPKNEFLAPSNSIITSSEELLSKNINISQLKLHSIKIPADFTGGIVKIIKNNCLELRYFLSKSDDVMLTLRDGIGGFYEIGFKNEEHDYWKSKAKLDQSLVSNGSEVDITESLTHLRGRFGDQTDNNLYFFCPFVKVGAENTEFEIEINLNKNPVELDEKENLDNEVFGINSGAEEAPSNEVATMEDRVKDIIKEIKGDGSTEGIKTRMEEAPENYYEVSLREIDVFFDDRKSTDVKKVYFLNYTNKKGFDS